MTLEISLKRALLTSLFIQTGNEKPRKPHWIGDRQPVPAQPGQTPGGKQGPGPKPGRDPRGYRDLSTITLGEVQDAYHFFESQLAPSPYESWIAENYFCMLELIRQRDGRPPAVFGRVRTCYPSDGYVHNIQEMELYFPNKTGKPDTVLVHADDILLEPARPIQSYCVRVKFFAAPEDIADFDQNGNVLLENGFGPEFSTGYIELLDMQEQDHAAYPWIYVISSRWFASSPVSLQPEIRERLKDLIQWNKLVFNYHPDNLPFEIKTLNKELGFRYGFTDIFLIEPADPIQTARVIVSTFEKLFQQPMK